MGMFDEVICDYPLPGTRPEFTGPDHRFQTKDLDCDGSTYRIAETGELRTWTGELVDFSGELSFYSSNCCAGWLGFSFTPRGEDYERVCYCALYDHGKLLSLTQYNYTREVALASSEMLGQPEPLPTAPEPEKLLGLELFILFGGATSADDGHAIKVVHETKKEFAYVEVADPGGGISTLHKHLGWGHLVWPSKEVAAAQFAHEQAELARIKRELSEKLETKKKARDA